MTYEKPTSRESELQVVKFLPRPSSGKGLLIVIEVRKENERARPVPITFSTEFIDDYFEIPGDETRSRHWQRILTEKRELFIKWALAKVEDDLEKGARSEEIMITYEKDYDWAKKIDNGSILLSSQPKGNNIYNYVPEKRLGFK